MLYVDNVDKARATVALFIVFLLISLNWGENHQFVKEFLLIFDKTAGQSENRFLSFSFCYWLRHSLLAARVTENQR